MFMQSKALGTGMDADLLQCCILFPLVFVAIGLIACCIGVASLLFKAKMSKDPHKDSTARRMSPPVRRWSWVYLSPT